MNNLKENLMKKINEGELSMKPRWHFILKTFLFTVAVLLMALITVYLLSFVMFVLHENGVWFAPAFGAAGLVIFIVSSPWIIISLVGLFCFLLYLLVRNYAFSYRKPFVYSLIGVVFVVIALSSLIQQTTMHRRVHNFALERNVPGLAPFYRQAEDFRPRDMTRGAIVGIGDDRVTIKNENDENLIVVITKITKQPKDTVYKVNDEILVFGPIENGTIKARGIKLLPQDGTEARPMRPLPEDIPYKMPPPMFKEGNN